MNRQARQTGSVLMISLVILMVLTLLGISTMQGTIIQTRMARNTEDLNNAFQAAEAALRDGEADVAANAAGMVFSPGCGNGLCEPAQTGANVWDTVNWATQSITYGDNTGVAALSGVAQQPRYIIEHFQTPEDSLAHGRGVPNMIDWYRVTAVGYGANPNDLTEVRLQSVVRF